MRETITRGELAGEAETVAFTASGALLGARRALPLAISGLADGLVFGVLARQAGMSLGEALLMSGAVNTGTAQFVALGLWAAPLPVVALAATTLVVGARHLLMGATLAAHLGRLSPLRRYGSAFFLTDETWALALRERALGTLDGAFILGGGLALFVSWVLSTAGGYLAGASLRDPARWGLDFVFPALVVALLAGMWRGRATLLPWGVAAVVALAAAVLLPGKWYILLGGIAGAVVGAMRDADRRDARHPGDGAGDIRHAGGRALADPPAAALAPAGGGVAPHAGRAARGDCRAARAHRRHGGHCRGRGSRARRRPYRARDTGSRRGRRAGGALAGGTSVKEGRTMIARIWRGVTHAAHADEYLTYLNATGLPAYRATPGNRGVRVLRRVTGAGEGAQAEFILISLWESWDAIRRFAGDDVEKAVYYPEDTRYLLALEPNVTHYEVVYDA